MVTRKGKVRGHSRTRGELLLGKKASICQEGEEHQWKTDLIR